MHLVGYFKKKSFVLFEFSVRVTVKSPYFMASGKKSNNIHIKIFYQSFILTYFITSFDFLFVSFHASGEHLPFYLISEGLVRQSGRLIPRWFIYTPGTSFRKQRSYYVIYLEFHSSSEKSLSVPNVPLLYCPFFYLMSLLLFNILFMYIVS